MRRTSLKITVLAGLPARVPGARRRQHRRRRTALGASIAMRTTDDGRAASPGRRIRTIGVTGSAGKTTTTHLTAHILNAAGTSTGFLSTVAHQIGAAVHVNHSGFTTMEAPEIQGCLADMESAGNRVAVVEASSHGLAEGRVDGCEFDVAAYTNIGLDHLDFHGTPERYLQAKARLITLTACATGKGTPKTTVLNRDDASFPILRGLVSTERLLTYAIDTVDADVCATDVDIDSLGVSFTLRCEGNTARARLPLAGRFNLQNALCATTSAIALGVSIADIAAALQSFAGVPGRLERIDAGQPFTVLVDFAHAPLRFAAVLDTLRPATAGRLIVVFGSSGLADHDARGTGAAVGRRADLCVITSADPGLGDPLEIAHRIEKGVLGAQPDANCQIILDRREAIGYALRVARREDVVVLAGKGVERTMWLADGPTPWNERAHAMAILLELGFGTPRTNVVRP